MPFPEFNQSDERVFNNADSFAMAFDEAWKSLDLPNNSNEVTKEKKLDIILKELDDHPFLKTSPSEAIQVAKFRIKLLKL